MTQITLRNVFNDRLNNFQLTYDWGAAHAALRLVPHAVEIVAAVLGEQTGAKVAAEILQITKADEVEYAQSWRDAIGSIELMNTSSSFFEELHELTAFARFGILTVWNSPREIAEESWSDEFTVPWADVPSAIIQVCDRVTRLLELIPDGPKRAPELAAVRDMALARLAYDAGELLSVHQLAALSDVSVKRVQNAVYADKKAPMVDGENRVTREGCERWLADRDFQPSIWQQVQSLDERKEDWGRDIIVEVAGENVLHDDFVFVPVADDGSLFRPSLKRDRVQHFTIGAKGSEEAIAEFDEALQKLSRMEVPYWRRPNANGNWGIVSGQSWKRIRRAELEALPR